MSYEKVFNEIKKVGVIGAGPAGLVAARELKKEGFEVVVYEQNADVGGIWLYNPNVGNDPVGLELTEPNQGTIYQSLRTNITREAMGYMDYPLLVKEGRNHRRFPAHHEILLYLKDFARDFNLVELIRFNTKVEYVGMVGEDKECVSTGEDGRNMDGDPMDERVPWVVRARNAGIVEEEVFDAVVVCNGHFRKPKIAEIPGAQKWPGKQIHSLNYRVPKLFANQTVAKEVHMSIRSTHMKHEKDASIHIDLHHPNVHLHPLVTYLDEDGIVVFGDGSTIIADSIIHCTGYSYSIPFLDTNGMVIVENTGVSPLYEHIFPPLLAPSLSFVGIPNKIISFPFFELQSKWIASILSRKVKLPSRRDMIKTVEESYDYHQEKIGLYKHLMHDIGNFEYCDQLADRSGEARFEEWRKEIVTETVKLLLSNPVTFRDMWDENYMLELLDKTPTVIIDS
ncbi:flavin-containing monooxygenase FMO GS-OX-like 8 isoform X2 [Cryptomeria japonica]|uniref:flavin-containing monooxygenase FMO GS-OX-like 8 isoform X2 n=1 Tax=Cryptomeria japonica TaxID=3369 RepID=UPI0025ACC3E2|nr:flavin-containing monooxygenase FMO GS-OX-like 8 isoform X2 [Cryptomeria japonica]